MFPSNAATVSVGVEKVPSFLTAVLPETYDCFRAGCRPILDEGPRAAPA